MIISDQILLFAFQCNASDIHIIQGEEPTYRIDGQIRRLSQINESENINTQCHNGKLNDQIIQEVLDNCGISNKDLGEKKNIDFAYSVNNKRFRVNVYFERSRMAAAFRALPENMPSIENLYSDPNLATTLYKLANLPNGLVLVNGPTGSGKSSTLAAIINYINQNHPKSIITIEDPIEYLSYKAESAGKKVVFVNPRNTSQICSGCGAIVKKSLSVRVHKCPSCGLEIDRDVNAAINILRLGTSPGGATALAG